MNNTSSENTLYKFIDDIIKTTGELKTIAIPELYNIFPSTLCDNIYYETHGFSGINALEVITQEQTILSASPLTSPVTHDLLYMGISYHMYDDEKAKFCFQNFTNNNLNYLSDSHFNFNQIILRCVNSLNEYNNEIESDNYVIIYGDIDNINNYQKDILLKSISSMLNKDNNIEIYSYNKKKIINLSDIINIETKNIDLDKDEILLSDNKVTNISNYQADYKINCIYEYDKENDVLTPSINFYGYNNQTNINDINLKILHGTKIENLSKNISINSIPHFNSRVVSHM